MLFYICHQIGWWSESLPYLSHMKNVLFLIGICISMVSLGQQSSQWAAGNQKQFFSSYSRAYANPSLLSDTGFQYGLSMNKRYGIGQLNDVNAGVFYQNKNIGWGIYAWNFGYSQFSSSGLQGAYSLSLDPSFRAGISISLSQTKITGYSRKNQIGGSLYASYHSGKNTNWAVAIRNIPSWLAETSFQKPSIDFAVMHQFGSACKGVIEASMDPIYSIQWRTGIDYQFSEKAAIQIGWQSKPLMWTMGFVYRPGKVGGGLSVMNNSPLGNQIGLTLERN